SRTTPYLCPFLSVVRRTPRSTLFPYTTLFRSAEDVEIDPVDRLDGPHLAAEHALVDREVLLQAADADQHLTGRDRRRGLGDGLNRHLRPPPAWPGYPGRTRCCAPGPRSRRHVVLGNARSGAGSPDGIGRTRTGSAGRSCSSRAPGTGSAAAP